MRTSLAAALLASSLLLVPSVSLANGRFPASTQLVFHPTDPDEVLIRVTFGLLTSHDAGKSFSWVCEKAVGYGGVQDPAVALTSDNAILVAAFEGLATSHDQGCSFSFVPEVEKEFVIDVAIDKKEPSSAIAVTSTGKGELTFNVQVLETKDAGKSWNLIGTPVDPAVLAETIDPAPSRPQRLYISGFSSTIENETQIRHGALVVSDDRGQTWERHDVDLLGDKSVYIAAVDPADPDRVYLRTRSTENDRLLVTTDGGKTITPVASIPGSMLGFALSPDGSRIAIGGPSAGVLVADTKTFAFTQTSTIEAACLAWNAQGLHACGNAFKDGFAVARSSDEGKSWEPLLESFKSLTGPIDTCSVEPSPASTCAQEWAQLKSTLGIEEGAGGAGGASGASGQAGAEAAGIGGTTAGNGTQGGEAGAANNAGAAGNAGAGAAGPAPEDDSSCSCRVAPGRRAGVGALGWALALGLLRRRRRAAR